MIKRPIWTSGWASLCLPVGWFGVTCPFRWEPPQESRQATQESSPWGPAGSRPQQPLGLGAGVCQAAGVSGQGRRAGRWPSLPASIVGPCADDLCLTSVSCPHAESSWCNFSEDKCQSSSCSCAGCGGCAQRLGGEKSPWGPAGSLSAGLGVSLCEPRPCGRGRPVHPDDGLWAFFPAALPAPSLCPGRYRRSVCCAPPGICSILRVRVSFPM